jgi:hypothetical protein
MALSQLFINNIFTFRYSLCHSGAICHPRAGGDPVSELLIKTSKVEIDYSRLHDVTNIVLHWIPAFAGMTANNTGIINNAGMTVNY